MTSPSGSPEGRKSLPDVAVDVGDGTRRSLADVVAASGSRPTLLAVFKVSCPTCKLAWPYLQKLHATYGPALRVVGVSQNDAASSAAFYREQGGATFDLVFDPEPAFRASNALDVEAVPHLALVNPDGSIEKTFEGWQKTEMEALARGAAAGAGLPPAPLVAADDPVPAWKAG